MGGQKIKREICEMITSSENKLSKVIKSIENWVMDVLKCEQNTKTFLWNNRAQPISEICGIKAIFKHKKEPCSSPKPWSQETE